MSSIDIERFREDINRYRNKTGMPWAALAEKAGVSPAMFTRIKKGSAVTLEAFAQLCSSFQLNPIDYMPELQTKPTKEQPMEDVKRLSIDGKDFTIEDVELRSGPAGRTVRDAPTRNCPTAGPRQHRGIGRRMALASRRREMEPYGTGRRPHRRIHRP